MAAMAALQSVLWAARLPPGCLIRVLTAPILCAVGSTPSASRSAASCMSKTYVKLAL